MTNISKKPTKSAVEQKSADISERFMWVCNTIFHQLVAVIGVFILWTLFYNNFENTLSRWHMILAATAYIPLMSEAIVLFASNNVWTQNINRTTRYYIHGACMFTSAVLATVGISFMVNTRVKTSATHFQSTHGWTGLVSWILVLLSQIMGIASAKSYSLKFVMRPVWFKFIHNLFGQLGYLFGLASLCYGLKKNIFTEYTSEESRTAITVLIVIVATWSIIAALKSGYNQLKSIVT